VINVIQKWIEMLGLGYMGGASLARKLKTSFYMQARVYSVKTARELRHIIAWNANIFSPLIINIAIIYMFRRLFHMNRFFQVMGVGGRRSRSIFPCGLRSSNFLDIWPEHIFDTRWKFFCWYSSILSFKSRKRWPNKITLFVTLKISIPTDINRNNR
jgi:hypothetical protein